ncbi:hypothetical protein SNE40_013785 [Patella caerulea]
MRLPLLTPTTTQSRGGQIQTEYREFCSKEGLPAISGVKRNKGVPAPLISDRMPPRFPSFGTAAFDETPPSGMIPAPPVFDKSGSMGAKVRMERRRIPSHVVPMEFALREMREGLQNPLRTPGPSTRRGARSSETDFSDGIRGVPPRKDQAGSDKKAKACTPPPVPLGLTQSGESYLKVTPKAPSPASEKSEDSLSFRHANFESLMGVDSLEVHPDAQKPPATETLEHCTSPSMPNPTRFLKRPIVTDVCLSPTERICTEFVDIGLTLPLSENLDEASKLPVTSKGKHNKRAPTPQQQSQAAPSRIGRRRTYKPAKVESGEYMPRPPNEPKPHPPTNRR